MNKFMDSTKKKVLLGVALILLFLGIVFTYQLLNKPSKDVYELQVKYLGGHPDVLTFERTDSGKRFELTVLKNGEVFKQFDRNQSNGQYDLPDLKVEAYDYSKVSYLLTQEQFETDHEFMVGSNKDWQSVADWHLSNMKDIKPFEIKAQYLSEDGEVLAEAVIQYIVVDELVPELNSGFVLNEIRIKKGETDLQGKFQEYMKKIGNLNGLEYTDSFTGEVDVNVVGSYPILVSRTSTRNGLSNKGTFTIIVEEDEKVVVEKPSTPNTNNSSSKPSTNNNSSKPSTNNNSSKPGSPNTNNSTGNNSGNTGGNTTTPTSPESETPSGMKFYKDYGSADGCISVMNSVLDEHFREWQSNFCDFDGKMYYTPYN